LQQFGQFLRLIYGGMKRLYRQKEEKMNFLLTSNTIVYTI